MMEKILPVDESDGSFWLCVHVFMFRQSKKKGNPKKQTPRRTRKGCPGGVIKDNIGRGDKKSKPEKAFFSLFSGGFRGFAGDGKRPHRAAAERGVAACRNMVPQKAHPEFIRVAKTGLNNIGLPTVMKKTARIAGLGV